MVVTGFFVLCFPLSPIICGHSSRSGLVFCSNGQAHELLLPLYPFPPSLCRCSVWTAVIRRVYCLITMQATIGCCKSNITSNKIGKLTWQPHFFKTINFVKEHVLSNCTYWFLFTKQIHSSTTTNPFLHHCKSIPAPLCRNNWLVWSIEQ